MKKEYYISTAIAYASSKPHVGNVYEVVLADAIARFKKKEGFNVYFQTGTDEHGQKIEDKAKEYNEKPQEYVDRIADQVASLYDQLNCDYDQFARTTNEVHRDIVADIYQKLFDQGDIYKGKYEGLYCIPCESFYTETQLVDGKCPDCGREVIKSSEDAYFLDLPKYQEKLIKYIENNPTFIQPEARKNEMLQFIKGGLNELCVSRTSFEWGIPLPFDKNHISYVWIDALSNYITFMGYNVGESDSTYKKYWPCNVHIIGKDILRFHAIYWPIILMALNEELPKEIYAHPWFMFGNDKMSKSKGNVLYTDELVEEFGVDPVRFYLLSEMPYMNDGLITKDLMIERINSELANTLGNLVNRTISMSNKYFDGSLTKPIKTEKLDLELINQSSVLKEKVTELVDQYKISNAITEIFNLLRRANKYIDETTPWILAKDESKQERLNDVLYNLIETIRIATVMLESFLPEASSEIFRQINTKKTSFESIDEFGGIGEKITVGEPKPIFMRIDKE